MSALSGGLPISSQRARVISTTDFLGAPRLPRIGLRSYFASHEKKHCLHWSCRRTDASAKPDSLRSSALNLRIKSCCSSRTREGVVASSLNHLVRMRVASLELD